MRDKILMDLAQGCALILTAFFLGSVLPSGAAQSENKPTIKTADYEEILLGSQSGSIRIIDARHPDSFNAGHIPNAINLPLDSPKEKIQEAASEQIDTIAYCSDRNCKDSEKLGQKLKDAGLKNIRIYKGGWEEWQIINGQ